MDSYNIPFPFPAYPQQNDLMNAIYECVDNSCVGIFESPTGTGKSLSLICSTMHWQRNEEKRILSEAKKLTEKASDSTPSTKAIKTDDWLLDMLHESNSKNKSTEDEKKSKSFSKFNDMLAQIKDARDRKKFAGYTSSSKSSTTCSEVFGSLRKASSHDPEKDLTLVDEREEDDEFTLENYNSDDDKKINVDEDTDPDEEEDSCGIYALKMPQIFYCSRTHSQISQFVREIKRTEFKEASDNAMSEKCLDMQKHKVVPIVTEMDLQQLKNTKRSKIEKKICACNYKNRIKEHVFISSSLGQIRDIEELVGLGQETAACPYYATRRAVRGAEIICLPYNMLLQDDLRKSMGLHLKGSVVIFDEAHNLVEAVNHSNSADISLSQLKIADSCVAAYLARYRTRLSGKNLYYLNLLLSVLSGLKSAVEKTFRSSIPTAPTPSAALQGQVDTRLLLPNDFIFAARLDNVNMLKLRRHIVTTNLVNKIGGFAESQYRKVGLGPENASMIITWKEGTSSLRELFSLLTCLMNNDTDGRVILTKSENTPSSSSLQISSTTHPIGHNIQIQFMLLNPSLHFKKLITEARSVILIGGTMQPFTYVSSFLFPSLPLSNLRLFSCGHVVSSANVCALVGAAGIGGVEFDFRHATRLSKPIVSCLKSTIREITQVVPNGIVVFLTSYAYLEALLAMWTGLSFGLSSVSDNLSREFLRPVYIEPRTAIESEKVWSMYSAAAQTVQGAVLFCVMGGKMSEGMPFADARDPILKEKLKHSDSINPNSSKKLYEAMCMKVVNQSIGRSIRHANDYATILLLDKRYEKPEIISQLPAWIATSLIQSQTFSQLKNTLFQFFEGRKSSITMASVLS